MDNHTTAKCKKCKSVYPLSNWSKRKIREAKQRRETIVYLHCPICKDGYFYTVFRERTNIPRNLIRCPVLFCPGYLIIEDEPYIKKGIKVDLVNAERWCGECGRRFATRKALDAAIEKMVEKYPHRKMVYKKGKDGHWEKVFPEKSKDSDRYEELLEEIEMADWDKAQEKKKSAKKTPVKKTAKKKAT